MNNPGWVQFIYRWGPALILMVTIFMLSSTPSDEMVDFGMYDFLLKKGAHMAGYGLLALAILRGLGYQRHHTFLITLLVVFLYAASDEFHQSFVPGRNASVLDVMIDTVGATVALLLSRFEFVRRLVLQGIK